MTTNMSKRDWIVAGIFLSVISLVFIVATIKGQSNRKLYDDFTTQCSKQNGVVVYNQYGGYECYENKILIEYYKRYE